MFYKIIILCILIYINNKTLYFESEGFSPYERHEKAKELFNNIELFKPNKKYKNAKYKLDWIDPIIFNDTTNLNNSSIIHISDLEKILN